MDQSIVSKGSDVKEAIELGLEILGVSRKEVDIEVLQRESKHFFRSKQAIVKLTKRSPASVSASSSQKEQLDSIETLVNHLEVDVPLETNTSRDQPNNKVNQALDPADKLLDGKAWVQDGRIFGRPSHLQYPTIMVGEGVKLYKNNEPVKEKTVLTDHDTFDIQVEEERKETKWSVELDALKLHATLHVEPGVRITRKVKDVAPDSSIVLESEEHIEILNELSYQDVLSKLEALRVIHGFHHNEIMKAIEAQTPGDYIIASGVKASEGKHGFLELQIDLENRPEGPQKRVDGSVDYRELKYIPAVAQGQVIAIIHPPVPGLPGKTVTNETIPPKQTSPLVVHTGTGTVLVGNKVVATESGRPSIEQKGLLAKISIVSKMVHQGNVNIASGNIRFKGDVDILGDVEESMVVEAEGIITVFKNVNIASISSKSSIIIHHNVIGSKISAGESNMYASEMIHILGILNQNLKSLILAIQQIINVPAYKLSDYEKGGLLPLIKILMERKFRMIPAQVKQFMELCKEGHEVLHKDWTNLAENLRMCFLTAIPNQWHSLHQLQSLTQSIHDFIVEFEENEDANCSVEFKYALNSDIYCSGNVTISGKGCYNSKIYSGGKIKIDGILRGGEVHARLGAYIKEVGSEVGVSTCITVPSDQKVKIDYARQGTMIKIGKVQYTFDADKTFIEARLNEDEKLIFH